MRPPASCSFRALGTSATVVTTVPQALPDAIVVVREEVDAIDRTCSRFRPDSELARLHDGAGEWVEVDPVLVEAIEVALRAAILTDGNVDPTVGESLLLVGYDRDFAGLDPDGPPIGALRAAPGWRTVEVDPAGSRVRIPRGVRLDLGATAKAFAADRSARAAFDATGSGVLVSLGGDIAVAGPPPRDGWEVGLADSHAAPAEPGHTVRIEAGGLATSSTTVRRWLRGGRAVHHVVDPSTGRPANEVWRTVSVAAATCVDANVAATAAIVRGEPAALWLQRMGMPARLVRTDGSIVRTGGWPLEAAA
ncbi:MAG TPA: FAD:protein FMN transferase [Actinomycetota bacterium]|jgi:thiamine biosynthesis lipoprotein